MSLIRGGSLGGLLGVVGAQQLEAWPAIIIIFLFYTNNESDQGLISRRRNKNTYNQSEFSTITYRDQPDLKNMQPITATEQRLKPAPF